MDQWTASLRSLMGLKHMSASSGWQVQREGTEKREIQIVNFR